MRCLEALAPEPKLDHERLPTIALRLATAAPDREAVKFGAQRKLSDEQLKERREKREAGAF